MKSGGRNKEPRTYEPSTLRPAAPSTKPPRCPGPAPARPAAACQRSPRPSNFHLANKTAFSFIGHNLLHAEKSWCFEEDL